MLDSICCTTLIFSSVWSWATHCIYENVTSPTIFFGKLYWWFLWQIQKYVTLQKFSAWRVENVQLLVNIKVDVTHPLAMRLPWLRNHHILTSWLSHGFLYIKFWALENGGWFKIFNLNIFKFTRIAYSSLKGKIFSSVYSAIKAYLICKWGGKLYKNICTGQIASKNTSLQCTVLHPPPLQKNLLATEKSFQTKWLWRCLTPNQWITWYLWFCQEWQFLKVTAAIQLIQFTCMIWFKSINTSIQLFII